MLLYKNLETRFWYETKNDKIVKLALLDYELKKQKYLKKIIDDTEIEIRRMPFAQEIDQLR